jgi:hypothetical protein
VCRTTFDEFLDQFERDVYRAALSVQVETKAWHKTSSRK